MSSLGKKLKDMRKQHNLTQSELAEKLGCAISVISGAESGRRGISKKLATNLADYFETNVDYWFDENAEIEFIRKSADFETTSTLIRSLLKNNIVNENSLDELCSTVIKNYTNINPEIMDSKVAELIFKAFSFDLSVICKKDIGSEQ